MTAADQALITSFPWVLSSRGIWHATTKDRSVLLCGETHELVAGRERAPQPSEASHVKCLALKVIELCDAGLAMRHGLPVPEPELF